MVVDIAVPPASALIPTEVIAVANANISVSVNPATVPADAKRVAINAISSSCAAKLFPRSTIVEPSLSTSPQAVPVIFANLAIAVAASCADKLVESPNITIVSVNLVISFPDSPSGTPN